MACSRHYVRLCYAKLCQPSLHK
uniref:Uncharacterized protein n=1 Tax=Anguilla anguilla TaxID=7936 RepID=A0A0E9PFE6_ANGAN